MKSAGAVSCCKPAGLTCAKNGNGFGKRSILLFIKMVVGLFPRPALIHCAQRSSLPIRLSELGYQVRSAGSGQRATANAVNNRPGFIAIPSTAMLFRCETRSIEFSRLLPQLLP
jgi:hypothetical protein